MKMLFVINSIILSMLIYHYNANIIVLPFRQSKQNYDINDYNLSNIFFPKELYTEILIGDPPQCLNININTEEYISYIEPGLCYDNSPSFYNHSLSKDFNLISERNDIYEDFYDGVIASDFFSFYNSTDLRTNVTKKGFEFFYSYYRYSSYAYAKYKSICGVAGLGLKQKFVDSNVETFLYSLKKKGLLMDNFWTYEYFNKKENKILNFPNIINKYIIDNFDGLIILGNFSNEYEPDNYDKNNYISTLSVEREKALKWDLIFNKIYCTYKEEISIIKDIHAEISINSDYIVSTKEYFEKLIFPFFSNFLEKQICKVNEIKKKFYIYEVISCNKDLFTSKNTKQFPTIYFHHRIFNYTFEITYKELFKEINNNIYFLILKNIGTFNEDIWKLGKIFLNKYHFSFNQDSKTIIFYNMKSNDNSTNSKEKEKFNLNLIWIIFCIICLIIGIYLGTKIIKQNRKIRANELQDEYDYKSENVNIDKRSNFINGKNIEMGIKGFGV